MWRLTIVLSALAVLSMGARAEFWIANETTNAHSSITQTTEQECQRTDRAKVPLGDYCCSIGSDDRLCWKSGPKKKTGIDGYPIPHYFELTEDYKIDLYAVFNDDNDPNYTFRQMVLDLYENFLPWKIQNINFDFIDTVPIENPERLLLRKGYRWDGASRGVDGEYATLLFNLRSSMIHDALYDMLRLEYLDYANEPWMPLPPLCLWAGINDPNYRRLADNLFMRIAIEDGHNEGGANGARFVLRTQGCLKANQHSEKNAPWRFHTLADAYIVGTYGDITLNDDGAKSYDATCAMKGSLIDFDVRFSRPIAEQPQAGKYNTDLHLTSWKWTLNDLTLVPVEQNEIGEFLPPYKLVETMTYGELTEMAAWNSGVNFVVLHIDNPNPEQQNSYFKDSNEIAMTIEFDTTGPIISGISEPVTLRSPNHKFVVFTIEDFVFEVTDDCTALSVEDLKIASVTSNEPDNSRGVGDGNSTGDIVIAPDGKSVALRAERQGRSDGRIYTINIRAVDRSGNETIEPFRVEVRHGRKR